MATRLIPQEQNEKKNLWLSHWRPSRFSTGVKTSQFCVSSGSSMVGLMATSSKRAYAIPKSLHPEPQPLWQSTADLYLLRRQGLGRTWTPVLLKNLLVLHSSPALVDKRLTGVMVAGLPLTPRGPRAPRHPASKPCPLHGTSSADRKDQVTWRPHGPPKQHRARVGPGKDLKVFRVELRLERQ